jgi:fimbrial chaperone protein
MVNRRAFFRAAAFMAIFGLMAAPLPVLALLVRPVLMNLTSSGAGANGSFEVVNDRNRPITVEISVNRLTVPERGQVVVTPDEGSDFQIFPPIARIPAGGRQIFRVRWIGEPNIPESRLFMFSTTELPVSEAGGGPTGVQIYYAINSVVAVRAPTARPDISISSVERATNSEGHPGVDITFENHGPAHGFVANAELEISAEGGGWSHTLRPADLNTAFGIGLLPPNGRRIMFLALDDVPAQGTLTARLRPLPVR